VPPVVPNIDDFLHFGAARVVHVDLSPAAVDRRRTHEPDAPRAAHLLAHTLLCANPQRRPGLSVTASTTGEFSGLGTLFGDRDASCSPERCSSESPTFGPRWAKWRDVYFRSHCFGRFCWVFRFNESSRLVGLASPRSHKGSTDFTRAETAILAIFVQSMRRRAPVAMFERT
jgi:hypothetical protein